MDGFCGCCNSQPRTSHIRDDGACPHGLSKDLVSQTNQTKSVPTKATDVLIFDLGQRAQKSWIFFPQEWLAKVLLFLCESYLLILETIEDTT